MIFRLVFGLGMVLWGISIVADAFSKEPSRDLGSDSGCFALILILFGLMLVADAFYFLFLVPS